jgi:hypothetical protein
VQSWGAVHRSTLLAAALLLAGCTGQPPAETVAEPSEEPAPATTEAASPEEPAAAPASPDNASLVTEPFVWDSGHTGYAACVPNGANGCQGISQVGGEAVYEFTQPPVSVNLALRWEALPLMEELIFMLSDQRACGPGCTSWSPLMETQGRSPLMLQASGVSISGEGTLVLRVALPSRTPSPLYTLVGVDQPFHVEGTIGLFR